MEVVQLRRSGLVRYQKQAGPVSKKLFGGRRCSVIRKDWQKQGKLSPYAAKRMAKIAGYLFELSLPRVERTVAGKMVNGFRCAFITLTLPATQEHSDAELKEQLLNQFLTEMRSSRGLRNYVWKAELQGNGNLHFHLIIDQFYDYHVLRKNWNRLLNKLGYIKRYSDKMKGLSLLDYIALRKGSVKDWEGLSLERQQVLLAQFMAAYDEGMANGWQQPNTVDTRLVYTAKGLSWYLSKYLSKDLYSSDEEGVFNEDRVATFGRLWGCSYSLSRFKPVTTVIDAGVWSVYEQVKRLPKVRKFKKDYVDGYFFRLLDLPAKLRGVVNELVFSWAIRQQYCYPVVVNVLSG